MSMRCMLVKKKRLLKSDFYCVVFLPRVQKILIWFLRSILEGINIPIFWFLIGGIFTCISVCINKKKRIIFFYLLFYTQEYQGHICSLALSWRQLIMLVLTATGAVFSCFAGKSQIIFDFFIHAGLRRGEFCLFCTQKCTRVNSTIAKRLLNDSEQIC